ncbi:MAG: hypothetical protein ACXVRS_15730, partial [Gaiellaceae bacterium]
MQRLRLVAGDAVATFRDAEVADELARRGEAADVADRGDEGGRGLHVDPSGTLINRSTSGQASAYLANLAVEGRHLGVEEVDLTQTAIGVRRSSRGSSSLASQRRPALSKASVTGGRSQRVRAKTPC